MAMSFAQRWLAGRAGAEALKGGRERRGEGRGEDEQSGQKLRGNGGVRTGTLRTTRGETLVLFSALDFSRMSVPQESGGPSRMHQGDEGNVSSPLGVPRKAERQAPPAVGRGIAARNLEGGLLGRSLLESYLARPMVCRGKTSTSTMHATWSSTTTIATAIAIPSASSAWQTHCQLTSLLCIHSPVRRRRAQTRFWLDKQLVAVVPLNLPQTNSPFTSFLPISHLSSTTLADHPPSAQHHHDHETRRANDISSSAHSGGCPAGQSCR